MIVGCGPMLGLEYDVVDPLFRPPLSLAVLGAALKYISTAVALEDPVLFTRWDFVKRMEESRLDNRAGVFLLAVRLLFSGLALYTFVHDVTALIHGFTHFGFWRWFHIFAMVNAFSPNTVAAVAACFVTEVKLGWATTLVREYKCYKASDLVAIMYSGFMMTCYVAPFLVVSISYGILGMLVLSYALLRDIVTLPWRLLDHNLDDIWIAVPILFALLVRSLVNIALILLHEWIIKKRYPALALKIQMGGQRISGLSAKMPQKVSANIIGYTHTYSTLQNGSVRDLSDLSSSRQDDCNGTAADSQEFLIELESPTDERDTNGDASNSSNGCTRTMDNDQCILNDTDRKSVV